MGIMEILKRKVQRVAFFRPVIEEKAEKDGDINFILEHFSLNIKKEDCFGYTVLEAEEIIAEKGISKFLEELIEKQKKLEKKYDFILMEGLSRSSFTSTLGFDINLEIAKNFGSPFVSVLNAKNKETSDIYEEIKIEAKTIASAGCSHFATFANRLDTASLNGLKKKIYMAKEKQTPVYLFPEIDELDMPTIEEVIDRLNCKWIFGDKKGLNRVIKQSKVAAMQIEHFLDYIEDGDLIIVPGDRADIVLCSMAANYSKDFPTIAGILLTGKILPEESFMRLLKGLDQFSIPILGLESDTYTVAIKIKEIPATITPSNDRKIALAMGLFTSGADTKEIEKKIFTTSSIITTPVMFEYSLFEKARSNRKKIVLPESNDERILRATEIILRREIADIVLLGNKKEIEHKCASLDLDLSLAQIIDPKDSNLSQEFAQKLLKIREKKEYLLIPQKT